MFNIKDVVDLINNNIKDVDARFEESTVFRGGKTVK